MDDKRVSPISFPFVHVRYLHILQTLLLSQYSLAPRCSLKKVKVQQFRYRPGQAQMVPGS